MPVVVIASPKGGAGKSTAAVVLGTELAQVGATVVMLDCDPNHSVALWASKGRPPPNMVTITDVTEATVVKIIKQHDADGSVVIVDLEGVASRMVSRAISQADLVLIPMRATILDATVGARSLALIEEEQESLGRDIAHAVVFTMTRAIRSKQQNGIEASLRSQGVAIIEPGLMERAAFSALFEYGGDLRTMPSQGNMEGAIENASAFAKAVLQKLKEALQ